jgi:hypothetical protein
MSDAPLERRTRSGRVLGSGERTRSPSDNPEAAARRREQRAATLERLREEEEELNQQLEIQARQARIDKARRLLGGVPESSTPQDDVDTLSSRSYTDDSSRSSAIRLATPDLYYGKTLKEHTNFIWQCDVNFRRDPRQFNDDVAKVLYAMQYLRGEPRDRWRARETEQGRDQASWQIFLDFLLDLIQNPVNRQLNTAQRYADARQRVHQSVHTYVTYIESLEDELPPYTEEQRRLHLLTTFRPEIRTALTNHQTIPDTRVDLIALAARLEENMNNQRTTGGEHQTRRDVARGAPVTNRVEKRYTEVVRNIGPLRGANAQPVGSQRGGHGQKRGQFPIRQHAGSGNPGSNSASVTCWRCGRVGHYATACSLPGPDTSKKPGYGPKNGQP